MKADDPNNPNLEVPSRSGKSSSAMRRKWGMPLLKFCGALLVIAALGTSILFVDETEYVIVERLGVISAVYDQVDPETGDRGLHWKLPWPIEWVRRFDRRLQIFDPPARELFTSDKKNITVDTYICWKINEPQDAKNLPLAERPIVKFFRGLGNIATCEARLDTRVRSILSSEMGKVELSQLLSVPHSEAGPSEESPLADLSRRILEEVRQRPDEPDGLAARLGIEVVDVGIKRLNLPEANLFAVYERMRKEREKIAQRYRSAGEAEKLVIESQAKRQSEEILAKAAADAERIRGEGEAEAIGIRNRAYARDPEFYRVLRTLESYRKILNSKTTLVLSASSSLLKLLTEGVPATPPETSPDGAPPPGESAPAPVPKRQASNSPATSPGLDGGSTP